MFKRMPWGMIHPYMECFSGEGRKERRNRRSATDFAGPSQTDNKPSIPSGCESLYKGGADSWSFSIRQQRAPKSPSASRPAPVTQPPQRSENMKASVAACAISLLFLLALCCSSTFSAPVGYDVPTSCCLSYTKKKMPLNRVASYYKTNSRCSQPAIVFTTKKGHDVCANPAEPWVRQLVEHLQSN
ncbi:uncharacterized protein LOC128336224 isoform X4 [Hemicordylus capensis]|uniref:uncharacterized protein LOC128336224 isoform X4 n=1 Tax=Hemicordylus capensis TaxID=884348 RepID=UPI0023040B95|nr:uncharacterized protein LOC128336224 isoform X4 [Hemicordylus capensis]